MRRRCILINTLYLYILHTKCEIKKAEKDLNDIFVSLSNPNSSSLMKSDPSAKDFTFDIDSINVNKFRDKLDTYWKLYVGKSEQNETRKRINWRDDWFVFYKHDEILVKTKILDIMLQTIFMARHKIKSLEMQKEFDIKDTTYRIAFLYRKMKSIKYKLNRIWSTIDAHHRDRFWLYEFKMWPWHLTQVYFILHLKAIRLNIDFHYFFYVMMKLQAKYNEVLGNYVNTSPFVKIKPTTRGMH